MIEIYFRSDRVKSRRRACGYTQQALADACGIPLHTLQTWEWGRREPHARTLARLAQVLGVRMEWLMNTSEAL